MGLRKNLVTGLLEDDGDPNTMPLPGMLPESQDASGLGGGGASSPPAPVVVPPTYPPKPTWEDKSGSKESSKQIIKSADTLAAEQALTTAGQATDNARSAVGEIEQQEAQTTIQAADEKAAEAQRRADEARSAEAARQETIRKHQEADQLAIDQDKKLGSKAAQAETKYWEGNPVGGFLAAVITSIGDAEWTRAGHEGSSVASRHIEKVIARHKAAAIDEWKNSKEAHDLERKDRAAYLSELDRREIAANNQSIRDLEVVGTQLQSRLAAFGPEKAKRAQELLAKQEEEKRAALKLENAKAYNRIQEREKSSENINRAETGPAGGGQLTGPQAKAGGDLGAMVALVEQVKEGVPLTPKAIETYALNKERGQAANEGRGVGNQVMKEVGRAVGFVPKGEMDGIPKDQQKVIRAIETLKAKQQQLISGAGVSNEESARLDGLYGIKVGDTPQTMADKMSGLVRELREKTPEAGRLAPALQQRIEKLATPKSQPKESATPPTKSPGAGAVYKTSSSHGPGWLMGGDFYPDSEKR